MPLVYKGVCVYIFPLCIYIQHIVLYILQCVHKHIYINIVAILYTQVLPLHWCSLQHAKITPMTHLHLLAVALQLQL